MEAHRSTRRAHTAMETPRVTDRRGAPAGRRHPSGVDSFARRGLCSALAGLIVSLLLVPAAIAQAPPPPTTSAQQDEPTVSPPVALAPPLVAREKRGLSVGAGTGNDYAALGVQARVDFMPRRWLAIAPFVALGLWPDGQYGYPWLGAAGLSAGVGGRNRLAVDVALCPIYLDVLAFHGTTVDTRVVYGASIAAGYERMNDAGTFFRASVGQAWSLLNRHGANVRRSLVLSLGVGVRIW
jgi:hypothetical protein